MSVPMMVDEVTFGGDIAAITSAMKEAVSQVEEHVHDVAPAMDADVDAQTDSADLTHRVNNVSLFTLSCYKKSQRGYISPVGGEFPTEPNSTLHCVWEK